MSILLRVDGGGTKTAFVLVDDSGVVLARAEQSAAYYLEHGRKRVAKVLAAGTAAICGDAGVGSDGIAFAFFALPGLRRELRVVDADSGELLHHTGLAHGTVRPISPSRSSGGNRPRLESHHSRAAMSRLKLVGRS